MSLVVCIANFHASLESRNTTSLSASAYLHHLNSNWIGFLNHPGNLHQTMGPSLPVNYFVIMAHEPSGNVVWDGCHTWLMNLWWSHPITKHPQPKYISTHLYHISDNICFDSIDTRYGRQIARIRARFHGYKCKKVIADIKTAPAYFILTLLHIRRQAITTATDDGTTMNTTTIFTSLHHTSHTDFDTAGAF